MLNAARSRLAVPVQLGFLGINGVALLLSRIYTNKTPDLYENNSHHKLGWVIIWVVVAQSFMAVVKLVANSSRLMPGFRKAHAVAPIPISADAMVQHHPLQQTNVQGQGGYSDDSGHGTASETSRTNSMSGTTDCGDEVLHDFHSPHEAEDEVDMAEKRSLLGNNVMNRFLLSMPSRVSRKGMRAINLAYQMINYVILLLGFFAITTGVVVYSGIFVRLACSVQQICNANKMAAARK